MNDTVKTVLVCGAGQMGLGIAQVAAAAGCEVLLMDLSAQQATAGCGVLKAQLQRLVDKNKMSSDAAAAVLQRLRPIGDLAEAAHVDLAIEAIQENEAVKRSLFSRLDNALPANAMLATNTSSISITRVATATRRPQGVVGMHFMNPVPVMQLVEIIRGVATSEETYQRAVAFAQRLGKQVVTAHDYPGFIVNRILMPMINEAAYTLMEGVANAVDIDAAMRLGTNQPMGPLTLADFIGLDTCLAILEIMHHDLGDPKYRPCPLLRRLVDSGRLGRKTKRGFHSYD